MDQHVVSRWLLNAFASHGPTGPRLVRFDKSTDEYQSTSPDEFLIEVDAHSAETEHSIQGIETPAAQAARRLAKRVRRLKPGFYAMVDEGAPVVAAGEEAKDVGVMEGMRLFVSQYQIPSPRRADQLALARYIGLMYQRAPKVEASIIRWGQEFDHAAQAELDRAMPGFRTGLNTTLATRRERLVGAAHDIGDRLMDAYWWAVRPPDLESFILSDCPVTASLALGHDDVWRAIFAEESYVVVMAIGPKVALVIAPRLIPISNIGIGDLARTINRLTWGSADRYVLGSDRTVLDRALPEADAAARRRTVDIAFDSPRVVEIARMQVQRIVVEVRRRRAVHLYLQAEGSRWQCWDGCRLIFGEDPPWAQDMRSADRRRPVQG